MSPAARGARCRRGCDDAGLVRARAAPEIRDLLAYERAAALHYLNQSLVGENADSLACSQPAHPELAGELRLRRHGPARADLLRCDPSTENRGYLQVDRRFPLAINGHAA